MSKFSVGDWVKSGTQTGVVRGFRGRSALVCWLGRARATLCGTRSIRPSSSPQALVLEGSLDPHLHSTRSEEDLLRNWLNANDARLRYKNVHTLADIEILGRAIGNEMPAFVHISCHGNHDEAGRAYIQFAPRPRKADRIALNCEETVKVFRGAFEGLPLLFSACQLGKYQGELQQFRRSARLSCIAAFTRDVFDAEAMIFELLVYHGVLNNGWRFATAVSKARNGLMAIGIRGDRGRNQSFVRTF